MRIQSLLSVAVLSFVYLCSYPLVIGRADESHLLYGARRVLEGQVLYKDFFEILTPLSYYLFAGIYRVAGTTLRAARVSIALIEALGCVLLFALVRRVSSRAEATLAALVFVGLCVPAWPYASPHWISTTLGLLVASVTLAERWQHSSRARPLLAGVLTGVAICVQQQRGAFLALWLPLTLLVLAVARPRDARWRTLSTEVAWGVGGAAIVTLVVLGHAAWASSPTLMIDAIYGFARSNYAPSTAGRFGWAEAVPLSGEWLSRTWRWLLRASPLFLLGGGLLLLRGIGRAWERPELVRACLWLLGVLMAVSIWYLPDFIHVSFVLPFLLVPGASLLYALRSWSGWSRVPGGPGIVAAGPWLVALVVAGKCAANLAHAYASAPVRFETAFGTLRGDAATERLFRAVRDRLVVEADGRRLLFSYPDDAWLYLALPADDATRFSVLVPGFFAEEQVREVIAALRARRPGTVVLAIPLSGDRVGQAVRETYELSDELAFHRIYVRR